jgi:hypothetical protein
MNVRSDFLTETQRHTFIYAATLPDPVHPPSWLLRKVSEKSPFLPRFCLVFASFFASLVPRRVLYAAPTRQCRIRSESNVFPALINRWRGFDPPGSRMSSFRRALRSSDSRLGTHTGHFSNNDYEYGNSPATQTYMDGGL